MGMVRSMMKTMTLPRYLWGESVRHAVYLLNRLPSTATNDQTPFESLYGREPNMEHVRIFGCMAHAKVPSEITTKLDDRSRPLVYLGHEPGSKAYRCLDPQNMKIIVSRDVVFDETRSWYMKENSEQSNDEEDIEVVMNPAQNSDQTNDQYVPIISDEPGESEPEQPSQPEVSTSSLDPSECYDHYPVRGFRSVEDVMSRSVCIEKILFERLLLIQRVEPNSYEEAKKEVQWQLAMEEELASIERNKTWVLVQPPTNAKPIGLKWVYKVKKDAKGEVKRFKARLVAKGYVQKHGVDYSEVFAPVTRVETVRMMLALAAEKGWQVHHLDLKTAFLYGELKEDVYVKQSEGFEVEGKEHVVYKLQKSLYGLKQAPRAWNVKLHDTLMRLGFERCKMEHAMYKRSDKKGELVVGVYVDDLIVTRSSVAEISRFKQQMKGQFDMSDLGLLTYYLGLEVKQIREGISIKQSGYAEKPLKQARMCYVIGFC